MKERTLRKFIDITVLLVAMAALVWLVGWFGFNINLLDLSG